MTENQTSLDAVLRNGPEKYVHEFSFKWIGGYCPVQAEGTINGTEWYYRSRSDVWSISLIHPEDRWEVIAEGVDNAGGWGSMHEAIELIVRELLAWAKKKVDG